jgi:phospholipid transport system substrate-binding protein
LFAKNASSGREVELRLRSKNVQPPLFDGFKAPLARRRFCRKLAALAATTGLVVASPALLGVAPAIAATEPDGAARFITWLADQAIKVMRSPDATLAERETALHNLLAQSFDLQFLGRFAIGRHWRRMSADQRSEYQRLFGAYILNTYASRFGGYSGETFSVVSARAAGKKDAVVRSLINRPSGPPIQCDWRVRATGKQYKIIDLMIEGVSMAVTQRSEFSAVIKQNGIDGLVTALRARVDKFPAITQ